MILTHSLVLLFAPPVLVVPQPAVLPLLDGSAGVMPVALPGRAAALLPALPVRAMPVLAVRGD